MSHTESDAPLADATTLDPGPPRDGITGAVPAPVPLPAETYDFLAPPQQPGEIGRLGGYRVLKVLGAGGMGVVFKAEDPQLQRLVALKAMLPTLAASPSAKTRFLREARAAAAITHDHIVRIYQVGEDRGCPFLAMEFLAGEALDDLLKRQTKLPLPDLLRVGRQIAEGLGAAHERGLVHRDIKPANVWLEKPQGRTSLGVGRAKILDFGLARSASESTQLTQQGAILGTPAYMAPEQARGETVDARCDLFSLGCVLYRMSTGAMPFKGRDPISTLTSIVTDNPSVPAELNPELPRELSDLVMRLLAKKPEERVQSAEEAAAVLLELERRYVEPSSGTLRLDSPLPVPARKRGKGLLGFVLCLLLLLVTGGLAAYFVHKGDLPFGLNADPDIHKQPPAGFVSLFNGKDLSSWSVAEGPATDWKVQHGTLVCTSTDHSWLKSEKQYSDFTLQLEWRIIEKTNSGVYLRAPEHPEKGTEIEIVDETAFPNLAPRQRCGAILKVKAPSRAMFKGVGQWNSYEITCKGHRITVLFNGEAVIDVDPSTRKAIGERPLKGFIGLQGGEGQIEFRNIFLRELDDKSPDEHSTPPIQPAWTADNAHQKSMSFHVALAPDGKALVAGGLERGVKLLDSANGKVLLPVERTHEIHALEFGGSQRFGTAETWDSRITVWDVKSRKRWLSSTPHNRHLQFGFSSDGRFFADLRNDGDVILLDLDNKPNPKEVAVLSGAPSQINGLTVSLDGKYVAARTRQNKNTAGGILVIWDITRPDRPMHTASGGETRTSFHFSPDSRSLVVMVLGVLTRWEVPTLKPQSNTKLDLALSGPFALSADCTSAVGFLEDQKILAVCDTTTGKPKATLALPENKVIYTLSITQDGKMIAASSDDGCVRLWKLP